MARNAYQYVTPDTRLAHLRFQRQREEERSQALDRQEAQRFQRLREEFQVEATRKAELDRVDEIGQQTQVEDERRLALDRRGVPGIDEARQRIHQVERQVQQDQRQPGIASLIGDVFRQTGRSLAPEFEEAFLPQNLGGLAPSIPPIAVTGPRLLSARQELIDQGFEPEGADVQLRAQFRFQQLFEEELAKRERQFGQRPAEGTPSFIQAQRNAEAQLDREMGEELRASQPSPGGLVSDILGAPVRAVEELGGLVGAGPRDTFRRPSATVAPTVLGGVAAGLAELEESPLGGPFARGPSGQTAFERGAELSRPVVQAVQPVVAEPFEQLGAAGIPVVSPSARGVASAIESKIVEDILTEVINPAALVLVAPLVMQGTIAANGVRLTGPALAAQMTSNLLGTGLEPALVRGTLRGLTAVGTRGAVALRELPRAVRETPIIQDALRNLREAPEAGASPLGGRTIDRELAGQVFPSELTRERLAGELRTGGFEPSGPPPRVPSGAIPPESAGNRFAAPLRDFDDVVSEVVTSDNPIIRALFGRTGVNPSILKNTPVGRAITAYWRQRVSLEELTKVALSASVDVRAQRFTGRTGTFRISGTGNVNNVRGGAGRSKLWQDVFSRPGDYDLATAQRAFIDDYHQVIDEMERLRLAAGLKPRAKVGPEGWFYTPRQVKGIKGVELRRPSNPGLQRHFEEAQEGVAAGIKYDADPRATLELHVRNAYREILERQFSDALAEFSVKPSELLRATKPGIVSRMEAAAKRLTKASREVRRLTVGPRVRATAVRGEKVTRGKLRQLLTPGLKKAKAALETARVEFNAAKNPYRRAVESARKTEVGPGNLFGQAEDNIAIAQWRNRFFPRDQSDALHEALGSFLTPAQKASPFFRGIEVTGNYIRFLSAVGDFAEPFIQGLPTLARNPVVWGKATLRHYQAFFDPTVQARFIRDHLETFKKMAQSGTPIGDPEFFAALTREGGLPLGRMLEILPGGGEARLLLQKAGKQTFGRFQASYNTGLGANRALLFEALRPNWAGTESELWAYIRNMTGGLDSRALGVGPSQRGLESSLLAFSPRLLRSTIALIGDLRLGLRNPRGFQAWRSLGQLMAGVTGIYVTTGLALGKDWKEIGEGLNPTNGKRFLSHQINGDWIGVGGQVRAIMQLVAGVTSAVGPQGRPIEDLWATNSRDNPFVQFYTSRGAPGLNIVGGLVEAGTGANTLPFDRVDSMPDLLLHLGRSALPFAIQGVLEGEQWGTTAAALAGARTSAETPFESRRSLVREITGKDEPDLEPGERFLLFEGDVAEAAQRFNTDAATIERVRGLQAEGRELSGEFGSPFEESRQAVQATAAGIEGPQLAPAASALLAGDPLALDAYNDARSEFFTARNAVRESEARRLGIEPSDLEPQTQQQALVDQYYDLEPTDRNNNGFIDKEDMDAFFDEQDVLLKQMTAETKRAIKDPRNFFSDPDVIRVEEMRLEAIGQLKKVQALPRYPGLSLEDGDAITDLTRDGGFVDTVRGNLIRRGADPDNLPSAFTVLMEEARLLREQNDPQSQIYLFAALTQRRSMLEDLARKARDAGDKELAVVLAGLRFGNPERDDLIAESEELLLFFPGFERALSEEQRAFLPVAAGAGTR